MMTNLNLRVAELNAVVRVVREWQRGAISRRHMDAECGRVLTADQVARLAPITRTTAEADVARLLADILGI